MAKDVNKLLAASHANRYMWIIVYVRPIMLMEDVLCEYDIKYFRREPQ